MRYSDATTRRGLARLAMAVAAALVLLPGAAAASPLDDARAAGLLGERPDGYVGAVPSTLPADVLALMEQINAERRERYEEIAVENGTTAKAVGVIAAEKIIERLPSGWYFMDATGGWVQK